MYPENIFNCLQGNNFYVNENLVRKYGLEFAAFIGYLISADKFFSHNGNGPWFFQTIEEMEERTGLKKWKQEKYLKKAEELGIIERKLMDMPAKRYIRINYERLAELTSLKKELEVIIPVGRKLENLMDEKQKPVGRKLESSLTKIRNNNNIYNNNINNNIYKEKENIKEKESIRSLSENTPSLLETSKNIETSKEQKPTKKKPFNEKENKNKAIIEEVIAYLNEKTGKHFTPKNKETVKFINGRLSEGYSKEDLKAVIDNRCEKWLNDEKMNEYLRPSTLFRPSKFEAYYNDVLSMKEKAVSEKEQEVIESFRGLLTPPNLPPEQALEQFKKTNNITFMAENDFKKFEQWYKTKIDEWLKKLRKREKKIWR